MRIVVARNLGFCMGVKRALETVLEQKSRTHRRIITYGPLIHNPQVVELLKFRGIDSSRDLSAFQNSALGFISAHGVSPEVRSKLNQVGKVFDASCPDVLKVQGKVKKQAFKGYSTVILGDRGHSEVEGLLGFTGGRGHVVASVEEVEKLPPMDKVCLVSQTTQNQEEFEEIARALKARYPEALVFPTICSSTLTRQEELKRVARQVQAMVVVGGKNSANTARLARLARGLGLDVFLIETAAEVDCAALANFAAVGVAAGASTPEWVIQEVVDRLYACICRRNPVKRILWASAAFLLQSKLYLALGAAALTYASSVFLGVIPLAGPALFSFFIILEISACERLSGYYSLLGLPKLISPTSRRRTALWTVVVLVASLGAFFSLAFVGLPLIGVAGAFLPLLALAAGGRYSPLRSALYKVVGVIPAIRETSAALLGALAVVLVPLFAAAEKPGLNRAASVAAFVSILFFNRCVLAAVPRLQKDRLRGLRTFPTFLGVRGAEFSVFGLNILGPAIVVAGWGGEGPGAGYPLMLTVWTFLFLLRMLLQRDRVSSAVIFHLLLDGQFIFSGLLGLMAMR